MISWPGFQLQSAEYFITCKQAGKQALSRLTGAPSLITNMWKYVFRSKISGLPLRLCQSSVVLSANMQTNTCIKGHMLPCKYYMLTREDRIAFTYVCKTCTVEIRACAWVYFCVHLNFPLEIHEADHLKQVQWSTYQPWKQRRALAMLLLSITSSVLHK